jgi:ATP-binding cassette subfamily F protein 3
LREARTLEREIEAAETALRVLEDELADPGAWSTPAKTAASASRHEAAKRAVEDLYARWEQIAG